MSLNIIVSNATCQVQNSNKEIDKKLRNLLSYKDQNVQYSITKAIKQIKELNSILNSGNNMSFDKSSIEKDLSKLQRNIRYLEKTLWIHLYENGEFGTGLLPMVEKFLTENEITYNISDKRIRPKLKQHNFVLKTSFPPLRYYQKAATKELMEKGRGIIVLPTGTGKTLTVAKMIWELGVNTLIITPSKAITDMMMDTMITYFGKGKVEKLNTKAKEIKKPIAVVNIQALHKIDPKVFKDVSAVFVDEFHHSGASTYTDCNKAQLKNCYFRVGVTATNFRTDGSDLALQSVLSNVLYEYSTKQAIKDKFLVQPDFEILDTECKEVRKFQTSYKDNIVNNEARNALIAQIANAHKEDHVLILVKEMDHGQILKELIPEAEFINGQEKDVIRTRLMDDFKSGKLKCLIGTSVIGEGVDLPVADVLIMAGGGKSRIQIIQNIGRVLRIFKGKIKALVYDFTDSGCKWLSAHSVERQLIYEEYLD